MHNDIRRACSALRRILRDCPGSCSLRRVRHADDANTQLERSCQHDKFVSELVLSQFGDPLLVGGKCTRYQRLANCRTSVMCATSIRMLLTSCRSCRTFQPTCLSSKCALATFRQALQESAIHCERHRAETCFRMASQVQSVLS